MKDEGKAEEEFGPGPMGVDMGVLLYYELLTRLCGCVRARAHVRVRGVELGSLGWGGCAVTLGSWPGVASRAVRPGWREGIAALDKNRKWKMEKRKRETEAGRKRAGKGLRLFVLNVQYEVAVVKFSGRIFYKWVEGEEVECYLFFVRSIFHCRKSGKRPTG